MEYFDKVPARWMNTNFLQTYLESRTQLFCKVVAELSRAEQIQAYNAMANTNYLPTAAFLLSCLVRWKSCLGTLNWQNKPSPRPKESTETVLQREKCISGAREGTEQQLIQLRMHWNDSPTSSTISTGLNTSRISTFSKKWRTTILFKLQQSNTPAKKYCP